MRSDRDIWWKECTKRVIRWTNGRQEMSQSLWMETHPHSDGVHEIEAWVSGEIDEELRDIDHSDEDDPRA